MPGRLIFQDILRAFRKVSGNIRNDIYAGFVETYLFRARLSPIVQYSIIIHVLRAYRPSVFRTQVSTSGLSLAVSSLLSVRSCV